jgi:serine/threonine protein kinase
MMSSLSLITISHMFLVWNFNVDPQIQIFPKYYIGIHFFSGSLNSILQKNILKPGIMPKLFHKATFNFKNLLSKARDLADALHYLHFMVQKGATIIHRGIYIHMNISICTSMLALEIQDF